MTIHQIAARLVELCRKADFETAQRELFAVDAVSIEPYAAPDFEKETQGLEAILKKGKKFDDKTIEMHNIDVTEPMVATASFCVIMSMDITMREEGRMQMSEICLYQVKDGKIISEAFYI